MALVKFMPFTSSADTAFWHELSQRKLTQYQLNNDPQAIFASYTSGYRKDLPPRAFVSTESFESGTLHNTNTFEEFKHMDIPLLARKTAESIAESITSGRALSDNTLLSQLFLVTFADLKKYNFYYWFAFPALVPDVPVTEIACQSIEDCMSQVQLSTLATDFEELRKSISTLSTFIVHLNEAMSNVSPLSEISVDMFDSKEVLFAFVDPSCNDSTPGWPLRNLIALLSYYGAAGKNIRILCYRHHTLAGVADISRSIVLTITVPVYNLDTCEHIKGVEKNSKGRLSPRLCNLAATMDPNMLASSAVDLNLKLMRWRLMPNIDLERISQTKCLLLGAGTLGCNVARALLGWGVRQITFVDNGRVSYSNPARQSLFQFTDSLNGGSPKAEAAATRLKEIFPGVKSRGICMSIPMAGHPISTDEVEEVMKNTKQLEELIKEHDVIMLLTDSREARWLPTVIAAAEGKVCITAALGFATFVVLRHGVCINAKEMSAGCYFCNDGSAPHNSSRDRTLDQQCTVSRPGTSFLASSLAVELMVNILHHPSGPAAQVTDPNDDEVTFLGGLPQQIRGSIAGFSNMLFSGQPFTSCIACSPKILEAWREDPETLVCSALNSPTYLEDLTGITQLKAMVDEIDGLDLDLDFDVSYEEE
eukprot:gene11129-3189_t